MGRSRRERKGSARPASSVAPARTWGLALVLFLAAVFAVKLLVLAQLQHHPLLTPEGGLDAVSYVQLARRVLGGDLSLGPGLYYLSPLYIYFLAATLGLSDSFTWVRLVQIGLGTAAVGCVFVTARDWFGRRAAWVAAALAALTGVFTFYEILILQASLDTFLTAAGLMFLTKALVNVPPEGGGYKVSGLFAGLFFGLQILNRPNVIVAVAGVTLSLLAVRRFRIAALLVAGVLTTIAPVVLRNAVVSRQFALVSSQGGLNFYIGNNESATGQYVEVPGVRANIEGQSQDTRRVAEQAAGHPLTDAQVSAHFTGLATTWMRGHPAAAARLFARKLALVFNAQHQWLDFSYPYYARDTGTLLLLLFVGPWLLVPLGLTGLIVAVPLGRRLEFSAWASFVPWYALGVAFFFVAERYRLPILHSALRRRRRRSRPDCLVAGIGTGPPTSNLQPPASAPATGDPCGGVPGGLRPHRMAVSPARRPIRGAIAALESADEPGRLRHRGDGAREGPRDRPNAHRGRVQPGAGDGRERPRAGGDPAREACRGRGRADRRGALRAGERDAQRRRHRRGRGLLRTFSPAAGDSPDSCYQVGLLALDAGAPDVAERYLTRALALRPVWPEAQQALEQARSRYFPVCASRFARVRSS